MTELERLLKAKIPCPETGIEIRHTICDICSNTITLHLTIVKISVFIFSCHFTIFAYSFTKRSISFFKTIF